MNELLQFLDESSNEYKIFIKQFDIEILISYHDQLSNDILMNKIYNNLMSEYNNAMGITLLFDKQKTFIMHAVNAYNSYYYVDDDDISKVKDIAMSFIKNTIKGCITSRLN